jgi:D-lactate dehydrogenase
VMVGSKVGADELAAMPALRLIATRSTGFDHVDLAAASRRGVTVCNVPAYGSATVAEYTFALLLSVSRRVHKSYLRTLGGEFGLHGMLGFDLCDKTLGVVGAGKIGRHVIQIASGFGMRVIAHDPQAGGDEPFEVVTFDELLSRADVIALCCPLNAHTRHLMNADAFAKVKPGVVLINTARGGVVDTAALLRALYDGTVAAAGLDVLEGEELMPDTTLMSILANERDERRYTIAENLALMRHPNVIVTPHMAYFTAEALHRILVTTADNIRAFDDGHPQHVVAP